MLILEKPFVSDLLAETAAKNQIPVLRNAMSERIKSKGYALNLLDDAEFKSEYEKRGRIYSMSENALEWIYKHLAGTDFVKKIGLLKNKAEFRRMCSSIYPDYYFKELTLNELFEMPFEKLKLPLVLKPSVGFLSAGVYNVRSREEWDAALSGIKKDFARVSSGFPEYVVGKSSFLLEQYISGEEYAVDAYFDEKKQPVILNIFHHRFADENDVSDRLYCTSKAIYDKYFDKFMDFLVRINSILGLHDFPIHIEFRYDGKIAIPIEINPLRFAGFCLNELQAHISGIHPVVAYLNNIHPDYDEMWRGRETDVFSFLVLERPAGIAPEAQLNEEKLRKEFSNILELRRVDEPAVGVFATLFTKTDCNHLPELDRALLLKMKEFAK